MGVFFGRRGRGPGTIFFATDIHGSTVCFKKFVSARKFYEADILILGGDLTGKMVVPIAAAGSGRYQSEFLGERLELDGEAEVGRFSEKVANMGFYPYRTTPDELAALQSDPAGIQAIFHRLMAKRLLEWAEWARPRLEGCPIYVAPGNDDPHEIDAVIAEAGLMELAEGRTIELESGHYLVSTGWTNPTPWQTHREESEEQLAARIRKIAEQVPAMERTIFNVHCPPHESTLDTGPDLDGNLAVRTSMGQPLSKGVGSTAVRDAVEQYQPLLGLFGHIHESRGSIRMGRTLCINPGSEYGEGLLRGCLVSVEGTKVRSFQLTGG